MNRTANNPAPYTKKSMGQSYNLLLVEDNMINLQNHTGILNSAGYNLEYSIAGNNLTEIVHRKRYDLVLFNMSSEGINGYDLIKKIKGNRINMDTPVVIILDEENSADLMRGLHISGIDFLKAPYNREELLTRINNQITFFRSKKKLEQSKLIADSINYAERIQKAMSSPESNISQFFSDHFLINLPRDIVSGDFYWLKKNESRITLAVADCTGHGVPGAFLSILGISLLNEIYTSNQIDQTGNLLDQLREKLKNRLLRNETNFPIADGMDISLISIDIQKKTLQFSGAFQKLLVIQNSDVTELRGDLQPIGIYYDEKHFTTQQLQLTRGARIYLTTDGYPDQFGGKFQKKIQFRNYRQLISDTSCLSMQEQKKTLVDYFYNWKGINDQVDDILLMGLEI